MYEVPVAFQVEITIKEEEPGYILKHQELIFKDEKTINFDETCESLKEEVNELLGFEPYLIKITGMGKTKEFYEEEILVTNAASAQIGDIISFANGGKRYKVDSSHVNRLFNIVLLGVETEIYSLPKEATVYIYR